MNAEFGLVVSRSLNSCCFSIGVLEIGARCMKSVHNPVAFGQGVLPKASRDDRIEGKGRLAAASRL